MLKIFNHYSTRPIMLGLMFLLALTDVSSAQETLNGTWKAKVKSNNAQKIHISFHGESEKGRHNHHGSSFKYSDLAGLSESQATGSKTSVNFRLNREAGNVAMTGSFEKGRGEGSWTFTPSQSFISDMKGIGFDNLSSKKLFSAALLAVKSQTAREIKSAGLQGLDFEDVIKATIFKIDGKYISEMNSAGFKNLDMEDLVKGRIFKIDAKYAKEVLAMGFGEKSLEGLVKFRIFKVTPEFLSEMNSIGLKDLDAEDVVKLRIFKINAKFVEKAKAKGHTNLSVEELVELKILGKVR